jgi:ADP-heptose:LPS heptosyltransferase
MRASDPRYILMIIIARIGDTLFVTPVIHALKKKFPNACIDVMAHTKRISVLENNHDINMLICNNLCGRLRLLPKRNSQYDMVFVYGDDVKLLRYGKKIGKYVIGFKHDDPAIDNVMDMPVPRPSKPMHAVDERLLLVNAIGVTGTEKKLAYRVSNSEKSWAESFVKHNGLLGNDVIIGFQVAGFPTKAYRDWPVKNFISLGKHVLNDFNAKILLFGSKNENKKAKQIQKALGNRAMVVAGKTTLRQAAALINCLDAFVTTDTGPMHIAFALEVPTVALFHCMHPSKYLGPLHGIEKHKLIQMDPQPSEKCGRHLTLNSISSQRVWHALEEILGH